jgi:hypothetical protein
VFHLEGVGGWVDVGEGVWLGDAYEFMLNLTFTHTLNCCSMTFRTSGMSRIELSIIFQLIRFLSTLTMERYIAMFLTRIDRGIIVIELDML